MSTTPLAPPIEQALERYYNESDPYLAQMQTHDAAYFASYVECLARYVAALPPSDDHTLLELGCAAGASTHAIARRFPHLMCTGMDISERNIAYAGSRFSLPNLRYAVGNCMWLDRPAASASVVTSFDYIEHVPDPERALEEMIRLIRPGGYIFVKCPNLANPMTPLLDFVSLRHRYPFTVTWRDNIPRFFRVAGRFVRNLASPAVAFTLRTPDLSDGVQVGDDADATYEASPLDLIKFFKLRGLAIRNVACPRSNSAAARLYAKLCPLVASIGVVAQKPTTWTA